MTFPRPNVECTNAHSRKVEPHFFDYKLLIDLLRDGETKERCHNSRKMIDIQLIIKHSGVQIFKIEDIKNLIGADKIEEALNLLRGQFKDDNEVIVQMMSLSNLERQYRINAISLAQYGIEKNKITEGVLKTLTAGLEIPNGK